MTPPADEPKKDALKSALDALRAAAPAKPAAPDSAAAALAALRAHAPAAPPPAADPAAALRAALGSAPAPAAPAAQVTNPAAILGALKAAAPAIPATNPTPDPLAALRAQAPAAPATPAADPSAALAALKAAAPAVPAAPAPDPLAALRAQAPAAPATPAADPSAALAALKAAAPTPAAATDPTPDPLAALRAQAPAAPATPAADPTAALAALKAATPTPAAATDPAPDPLAALRAQAPAAPATPAADPSAALAALKAAAPVAAATDPAPDPLAALRAQAPAAAPSPSDDAAAALAALRQAVPDAPAPVTDSTASVLGAMRLTAAPEAPPAETSEAALAALRATRPRAAEAGEDAAASVLGAMRLTAPAAPSAADDAAAALAALRAAAPAASAAPDHDGSSDLDDLLGAARAPAADLLGDLLAGETPAAPSGAGPDLLDDLLAGPAAPATAPVPAPALQPAPAAPDLLDDLLSGSGADAIDDLLAGRDDAPPTSDAASDLLDDLLGTAAADPLDDLLSAAPAAAPSVDDASGLLDALFSGEAPAAAPDPLADLLADPAPAADPLADLLADPTPAEDPLEALFAAPAAAGADPLADLEALLAPPPADPLLDDILSLLDAPPDPIPGLDDLLADIPATAPVLAAASVAYDPRASFGRLTAGAPAAEALERRRFRIAVLGDFSGRAAGGMIDVGVTLARRPGIRLDIDTVEEVIDRFATTLLLPIGEDGRGIEVPLKGIDSLHPDELVHSVPLFDELKGLRQRLGNPRTSAAAVAAMQSWRAEHATHAYASQSRSAAQAIPADRPLSEFQKLIGDTSGRLGAPTAASVESLISRIVGPYVRQGPAPEAGAAIAEVDKAMSAAMRLVLHHPEFQAIEAAWRTLDLLARRINGDEIEITLFDISAQEMAADLATGADLSRTGIFQLLNAPLMELGDTGFSAVFGLYGFEETPPHAELLGRIGQIAAHLRAPFFAAISPKHLEVARNDRHPLVARAWDALAAEPGAGWLSLLSPRFLMRRPYGKRTEPIDAFDFEEFTLSEGLHGMLWGNPAVLMAVLLSRDWEEDGARMRPGKRLTVNEIPFHYVTDPHGDQVALPCTERLITLDKSTETVARGLIPVLAVKGRDEVRLGSVQSLAGQMVQGRWTDAPPPPEEQKTSYGGVPRPSFSLPAGYEIEPEPAAPAPKPATAATAGPTAAPTAALDDLDALLAGFGDTAAPINPESIDADLAALLEGL